MPTSEASLFTDLEAYLKREGLLLVIPAYRRDRLFKATLRAAWGLFLWAATTLAIGLDRDVGWAEAVLYPPVSVAIVAGLALLLFGLFDVHPPTTTRRELVAVFLLLGAPVTLAFAAGWATGSVLATLGLLAMFAGGVVGLLFARHQGRRLYTVYSLLRLAAMMIVRSLKLATILMPLLLVFVLFSVFSQEIWQVFSSLRLRQVAGGLVLISIPAMLYAWANFKGLVRELTPSLGVPELHDHLQQIPGVRDKLDTGYLSPEEVERALVQLRWRDVGHLRNEVIPSIQRRLKLLLWMLALSMTMVLSAAFAVYFFLLFYTLIPDAVAAGWMEMDADQWPVVVRHFDLPAGRALNVLAVHVQEMQTAAALGVLLAIIANVYALAEENIRNSLLRWLRPQVAQWQAAGLFYRSLLPENIQVVGEPVMDARRGEARVEAVVPGTLDHEGVEAACRALRAELSDYKRVVISAYPRSCAEDGSGCTDFGHWWQMTDDLLRVDYRFTRLEGQPDPVRFNHFLGQACIKSRDEVPEEWFGDAERTRAIGRAIWTADLRRPQRLILHPYVFTADDVLTIEVRMLKRLVRPRDYDQLYGALRAAVVAEGDMHASELRINLLFRDQPESVGSGEWSPAQRRWNVRDELGRLRFAREPAQRWLLGRFSRN